MIIRAWPLRRAPGTRNEDGMRLQSKMFHELTTRELYEILKARAEIFVVEQNCVYQDLDDWTGRQTSWFISGLGVRFYGSCLKAHGKKALPESISAEPFQPASIQSGHLEFSISIDIIRCFSAS